jgi:hypothetical protein
MKMKGDDRMLKTLLRISTIGLFIVLGLEPFANRPQAFRANRENPASGSQSTTTTVEVTFDGLMVFAQVGNHYEVGIVPTNHQFGYLVGKPRATKKSLAEYRKTEKNIEKLFTSAPWTLQVVNAAGNAAPANISARSNQPCNRPQDTMAKEKSDHALDFCWIMDLEGEFHGGQPLKLKQDVLKPIILLNNGELYTKFKYDELEREQRPKSGSWNPYGFVAETLALKVNLREGEHLVLSNGTGQEVFRLPSAKGDVIAGLYNSPPKDSKSMRASSAREPSHFLYYYDLFTNVAENEKVDIQPKQGGLKPLNPFPKPRPKHGLDDLVRMFTFDNQECGAAFLGVSNVPLK